MMEYKRKNLRRVRCEECGHVEEVEYEEDLLIVCEECGMIGEIN